MNQCTSAARDKQDRVVEAARRLFVARGFHNVSIPAIVKASGVSTGAIYNYFATKQKLAAQIHQQTLSQFQGRFVQRLSGKSSAYDKLRAFAELVYELAEEQPDMMEYLLFMKHCEFIPDAAPICFTEPFALIRQIIAEGMAAGELSQGDVFISAVSFTGAVLRPVELRFRCVLEKPLPEISEELIRNAWNAIKA